MDKFVVLECHLWLNITEIKNADKTALLDSSVSPLGLSRKVMNTISETRAPSSRCLYTPKWSIFSGLCSASNVESCGNASILSCLQEVLMHPVHAQGIGGSYCSVPRSYNWPIHWEKRLGAHKTLNCSQRPTFCLSC